MSEPTLSKRIKVFIALGILVALSFFVAAIVTFIHYHDWPAKYISAGVGILAALLIALRRRARHRSATIGR